MEFLMRLLRLMNAVGSEDVVLTAYLDEKIDLWSLEVDS